MTSKNTPPRLGRGLAALLGDVAMRPGPERGTSVGAIAIDQIDPNPFQPRSDFNADELESLAESIRVQGVLQPILVRSHPTTPERYQIVAGERRFRAALQAGLTEIPTILRDMDDSDAAVVALVENLQRQDLNAIEEAEGYQRLLVDFGLTHESLGFAVSKSRSHIGNTVRLLRLPEPLLRDVRSGALSSGHARALINAPNPEALADQVLKRAMSVRQTEMLVNRAVAARGAPRQPTAKKLDVAALEHRVTEAVGSRVTITTTRKGGGEISIQFRDLYQLEDLIGRLTGQRESAPAAG
ncbi:MAG: ParB family transcriptional regulator, chromosome partitioning protein [Acetobacteraceae bacterium]|jgi:ParB family chromosome partitioning protein|nr:ParB/RepB/Spo0J family partition protein [Rhodopila sp.]MEA2729117.1 ParB family transcriptional regulator, chromosome partitioning protein [Acetobacteraceae bacterium]MEA2774398.1 ParB family transcriptional regulator, chromosome partitioning protein [Acetobacteraceae bacterium]